MVPELPPRAGLARVRVLHPADEVDAGVPLPGVAGDLLAAARAYGVRDAVLGEAPFVALAAVQPVDPPPADDHVVAPHARERLAGAAAPEQGAARGAADLLAVGEDVVLLLTLPV